MFPLIHAFHSCATYNKQTDPITENILSTPMGIKYSPNSYLELQKTVIVLYIISGESIHNVYFIVRYCSHGG